MRKRGELTSTQIILTILAIAAFVIVLIFVLSILNIQEQSQDEICKLSVLTRATVPDETQQLAPLNCHTKKTCLTLGDNDCPQFTGEKNVKYVKVSSARQIEHEAAEAMLNCWSLMGQGKLNLFNGRKGKEFITNFAINYFDVKEIHPMCVICSRVAISKDLENNGKNILKDVDINEYIRKTSVQPGGDTYLQTFTDKQINAYPSDFKSNLNEAQDKTHTKEMAFIFSQFIVNTGTPWENFINKGTNTGVALGGGALLTPAGKVASLTIGAVPTAIGVFLGALISGSLAYIEADTNQGLAALYCGDLTGSKAAAKQGCSIISPVDYSDINKINELCNGGIEGFP
jgi:hypothetical protein